VGLITLGATIVPFIVAGVVISVSTTTLGFTPPIIVALVAAGMYLIAVILVAIIVGEFTEDFVVPIMYLHACRATAAWRVLLDMLSANKGRFVLYVLVQIAIGAAITSMVFMAACCTCCLAACLFILPYIGTVVLLPVHVFTRSYSLYYLAQYGPEFNVFAPSPGEPCVTGEPGS